MTPDRLALLRLARAEGVGPVAFRRLLTRHPDPEAALRTLPAGARVPTGSALLREADALDRAGGRFLLLDEPDYPPSLAAMHDAPPVLAVLGDVALLAARAVAIVGARNASANGRRIAELLAAELARAGVVVVSGLARGIDTAAHEGAAGLGRTVAVIAGGLDRPYPAENAALQARIAAEGGAVVAEMPLGTVPTHRHFPRRNRIVAGLALGCVVVEAAPHSGSLITAGLAREAGREIFAVPGSPLDPRARGSNDLLREGAVLCETAADVLAALPAGPPPPATRGTRTRPVRQDTPRPQAAPPDARPGGDTVRATVLALLGPAPTAIDDLIRRCQFSASLVTAVIAELELDGRIETLPGSRVCLLPGP